MGTESLVGNVGLVDVLLSALVAGLCTRRVRARHEEEITPFGECGEFVVFRVHEHAAQDSCRLFREAEVVNEAVAERPRVAVEIVVNYE